MRLPCNRNHSQSILAPEELTGNCYMRQQAHRWRTLIAQSACHCLRWRNDGMLDRIPYQFGVRCFSQLFHDAIFVEADRCEICKM